MLLPSVTLHTFQYFECKVRDVMVCTSMKTMGMVDIKLSSSQCSMAKVCSDRGTFRGPFSKPRATAPCPPQGPIRWLEHGIAQELHRSDDFMGRALLLATAAYRSTGTR
uniref:Uncharacterized protein n=1 Tax=Picocystis salinarum TaxID=88271 RepID=A0A7S3UAT8_9CHLO